jgi:pyruvoyl-dependent arginine decarboxylase (PvlArgDC)
MRISEWFPVKAIVLSQGTGLDVNGLGPLGEYEGGLGAWDSALHDGGGRRGQPGEGHTGAALARLNYLTVSSVIPKGVRLYRLDRKRALEIDPGGMLAPAVYRDVRSTPENRGRVLSAGVGIGVADSPYDTGIIFTAGGPVTAAECETILRVQVTRGMERRVSESGTGRGWTFHSAIGESVPDPEQADGPDVWRAATAVAWFLDEYAWRMYSGVVEPL